MSRLVQIRFGYGTGPRLAARAPADLMVALEKRDRLKSRYPVTPLPDVLKAGRQLRDAARNDRPVAKLQRTLRDMTEGGLRAMMARALDGDSAFRERLAWFWADHFSVTGSTRMTNAALPVYVDTAIRPHLSGRFADMLKAVVTHPSMLMYLDQAQSFGPSSPRGLRQGRGLNENLAREVLELHTLGVAGAYDQQDVRELAELMTGLGVSPTEGFVFRHGMVEPGAEMVLGRSFGGGEPRLEDVLDGMEALAAHPDTARHIAWKLARHFTDESPDEALVRDMASAYAATGGVLLPVYEVLLSHPAALTSFGAKAKTPLDFVLSALVAVGARPRNMMDLRLSDLRRAVLRPLAAMGQAPFRAPGPDGWPEEAAHWITPQGLATRIVWSLRLTERLADHLAEPDRMLETTLGDLAGADLRFAVRAAETRTDAIALVLASAEFNRR